MIYLGAAMSVTAFPVLARIIQERGIAGTALGTLALAAGAINDIIAWCLLGVVLASVNRNFDLVRLSASHAVFGAFVMGALMPRGWLTESSAVDRAGRDDMCWCRCSSPIPGLSRSSVCCGRPTAVALARRDPDRVGWKGRGCWGAARLAGRPNREAMAIGALMNARGLMELIILNIGLERGLITPTLFTVMVIMTLVTTIAAGPLFEWAWRGSAEVPDGAGVPVR